ncbi:IQ motif and SEC7 domain-containing protein 3 [Frankliniella fusca]|uniref:IQ motif and SEC7 domain-containing protein 3 n=1 Tax=Frankliniella fusca TaxID=407009 RepID=A0AAE1HHR3_9NEOP|nr:IQ motif and SEC7 domain-containing protein 3 [Frankliniella fusca]
MAKPSVTMHLGRSPVPMTAAIHSEKMVLKSVAVSFRWVYQNPNGCFHLPYIQRTMATITSSPGMLLARLFKADIMMLSLTSAHFLWYLLFRDKYVILVFLAELRRLFTRGVCRTLRNLGSGTRARGFSAPGTN